jgi:hypothetical protein
MRTELISLNESAVELLADAAVHGQVYWINNPGGAYAVNTRTRRRCTKLARALKESGAIRDAGRRAGASPRTRNLVPTVEGLEALIWHRPALRRALT